MSTTVTCTSFSTFATAKGALPFFLLYVHQRHLYFSTSATAKGVLLSSCYMSTTVTCTSFSTSATAKGALSFFLLYVHQRHPYFIQYIRHSYTITLRNSVIPTLSV
jgi:hypothetical protein